MAKSSKGKISKKKLKKYWDMLGELECEFHVKVIQLENLIRDELGIDDLEFFWADGEIVGIGNVSRTIKLIHR